MGTNIARERKRKYDRDMDAVWVCREGIMKEKETESHREIDRERERE